MPHARGVILARFRVAVAAAAALSVLALLVYLLTGGTLLQRKATLYLYIPDATGLSTESSVRVNGTGVGKVAAVALSGSNLPQRVVRLTLSVEHEHLRDIPVDSTAQISSDTAVGDKYVDITQGKSRNRIRGGGEIFYRPAPQLLKTIDLQQFAQQLRNIDSTLTDIEQGKTLVGQLVVGDRMYRDLGAWLADGDRAFRKAVNPSSGVGNLLYTDQLDRQITEPIEQLDDRLARIQAGQGEAGRLLRNDGQYQKLRQQAADLRRSIAEVRGRRIFISDHLYIEWNRALASLIRKVDDVNTSSWFSNSSSYDNLDGWARRTRDSLKDFRDNPKKYLRIQLF